MNSFVNHEFVGEVEALSPDDTIGHAYYADAPSLDEETSTMIDPRRLRQALILAEDYLTMNKSCVIDLADFPAGGENEKALVIRESEDATEAVILAPRHPHNRGDEA